MSDRNSASVPEPLETSTSTPTVCHYCIVGCSYDVYRWPEEAAAGGPTPDLNALGADFSKPQPALGVWISPQQHTVVQESDGRRYNVVIVPNRQALVNGGLASVRGGTLAASLYTPDRPTKERLGYPLVYRGRDMIPTSWDEAVELVARVVKQSIDKSGPDSIFMKFYDHGGGGGGFENNWAIGKFFFNGIKTKMLSIHNRPAYNSEVHSSRDEVKTQMSKYPYFFTNGRINVAWQTIRMMRARRDWRAATWYRFSMTTVRQTPSRM